MNNQHIILRDVTNDSRVFHSLPKGIKIKQVWTLINEELYKKVGLQHNVSAFIEERMHDWRLSKNGELCFYGHSGMRGDKHDLVLVLE